MTNIWADRRILGQKSKEFTTLLALLCRFVVLGRPGYIEPARSWIGQSESKFQPKAESRFAALFKGVAIFDKPVEVQSEIAPFYRSGGLWIEKSSNWQHCIRWHGCTEVADTSYLVITGGRRQLLRPVILCGNDFQSCRPLVYPSGAVTFVLNRASKSINAGCKFGFSAWRRLHQTVWNLFHYSDEPSSFLLLCSAGLNNSGYGGSAGEEGNRARDNYVPLEPCVGGLWGNDKGAWHYLHFRNAALAWMLGGLGLIGGLLIFWWFCFRVDFRGSLRLGFAVAALLFLVGWCILADRMAQTWCEQQYRQEAYDCGAHGRILRHSGSIPERRVNSKLVHFVNQNHDGRVESPPFFFVMMCCLPKCQHKS